VFENPKQEYSLKSTGRIYFAVFEEGSFEGLSISKSISMGIFSFGI